MPNHSDSAIRPRAHVARLVCLAPAFFAILLGAGCSWSPFKPTKTEAPPMPEPEAILAKADLQPVDVDTVKLAADLKLFEETAEKSIDTVSEKMKADATKQDEKDAVGDWTDATQAGLKGAIDKEKPLASLVDLWSFAAALSVPRDTQKVEQMDKVVKMSEDNLALAMEMATGLRDQASQLAKKYMPASQYNQAKTEIETYAKATPMGGNPINLSWIPFSKSGRKAVDFLWQTPLAPFSALQGVSEGGRGVRDISLTAQELSVTADRFTNVVEELPGKTRTELQGMIGELNLQETANTASSAMDRAAVAASSLSQTSQGIRKTMDEYRSMLDGYPDRLRGATLDVVKAVSDTQPEIRRTIADTRELVVQMEALAQTTRAVATEAKLTATEVGSIGKDGETTATRALRASEPDTIGEIAAVEKKDKKPFDILDYNATAQSIGTGAQEVRGMLTELKSIMQDKDTVGETAQTAAGAAKATMSAAKTESIDVVDHISLRLAQLVGLIFVLAVLKTLLTVALRKRADGQPGPLRRWWPVRHP